MDEELRNYLVSLEERMNQRMAQMEERLELAIATLAERKPEAPEYLNSAEAAAYVRVHIKTLQEWVRLDVFPLIPFLGPGRTRYSRTMIDEWAKARVWGKGRIKAL